MLYTSLLLFGVSTILFKQMCLMRDDVLQILVGAIGAIGFLIGLVLAPWFLKIGIGVGAILASNYLCRGQASL
jgi:hypothetical protein